MVVPLPSPPQRSRSLGFGPHAACPCSTTPIGLVEDVIGLCLTYCAELNGGQASRSPQPNFNEMILIVCRLISTKAAKLCL
jgi:hypothetical protein